MIAARERWSFAAGDLGFNFVWQSTEFYLLYFYVRGLGLAPGQASAIFLVGAIVDWIADPLIGAAADRWSPRVPLRTWVAVGGPASVLLLGLAFLPWPAGTGFWPALLAYCALRLVYSLGNIPYAALTARISPVPADHLALTTARMQAAATGGLIATSIYALLPADGNVADFRLGAVILAGLAMPTFWLTVRGVRERVAPPTTTAPGIAAELIETVRLVARSAPLRRLLATILAAGLAVTAIDKGLLFLFEERGVARLGYLVAPLAAAALLASAPGWGAIGRRWGHVATVRAAALVLAAALIAALLLPGWLPLLLLVTLAIVAGAGMSIMFWTLVPAVVAGCERDLGASGCAVRVYALATMSRKLAQALAPQAIALALALPGLDVLGAVTAIGAAATVLILSYPPRAAA